MLTEKMIWILAGGGIAVATLIIYALIQIKELTRESPKE